MSAQTAESVIHYIFVGTADINRAHGEVSHWEKRADRGPMSVPSVTRKAYYSRSENTTFQTKNAA